MRNAIFVIALGVLVLAAMMSAATAQEAMPSKTPAKADTIKMAPKEMTKPMPKTEQPSMAPKDTMKAPVKTEPPSMAPKETMKTPAATTATKAPAVAATQAMEGALKVDNIACGTSVEDRELMGAAVSFPSSTEKVYCWSLITGSEEPATVEHVWYHGGQEMARVKLPVDYPRVRTWSYKTMMPEWTGDWKVEVVDEAGKVLGSTEFTFK